MELSENYLKIRYWYFIERLFFESLPLDVGKTLIWIFLSPQACFWFFSPLKTKFTVLWAQCVLTAEKQLSERAWGVFWLGSLCRHGGGVWENGAHSLFIPLLYVTLLILVTILSSCLLYMYLLWPEWLCGSVEDTRVTKQGSSSIW